MRSNHVSSHFNHKFLAWSAQSTRTSARTRSVDDRRQRAVADSQGPAHAFDGDERAEWQIGLRQLRARVRCEGGHCELFVAQSHGLKSFVGILETEWNIGESSNIEKPYALEAGR